MSKRLKHKAICVGNIAFDPNRGFKSRSLEDLPEMIREKENWEQTKGVHDTGYGTVDLSQMKIYVDHKKVYPRWHF